MDFFTLASYGLSSSLSMCPPFSPTIPLSVYACMLLQLCFGLGNYERSPKLSIALLFEHRWSIQHMMDG